MNADINAANNIQHQDLKILARAGDISLGVPPETSVVNKRNKTPPPSGTSAVRTNWLCTSSREIPRKGQKVTILVKQSTHGSENRRGDILQANDLDAVVNPVNCAGIMGKGLAQQFAKRYPEIVSPYRKACQSGTLTVSNPQIMPTKSERKPHYVVNLATKVHWKKTVKARVD